MASALATERRRVCRKLRRARKIAQSHAAKAERYNRAVGKAMNKGIGVGRDVPPGSPLWDVEVWAARVAVRVNLLHCDNRRRTHPRDQWAKEGRDYAVDYAAYPSDLLPYNDSAAWDWWGSLTEAERIALRDDMVGPRTDALNSEGVGDFALVNPAFVVTRW
jgi:hypothetical protein